MEDDHEKLKLAKDKDEDVVAHKLEPTEGEKLKLATDEGEDVEGHKL